MFARVEDPITQALKQARLSVEDIGSIEILGGGVRVPKVQEILKSVTAKDELHVHLNGDEAMCFGSAYIVSNFSSSFKVKHFYLTQHPKYDIRINISPLSGEAPVLDQADAVTDGEEGSDDLINYHREVILFGREHYLG